MRVGSGCRFQAWAARATNGLETAGDIYSFVKLFGFEQAVVGGVEVFSFDIETGQSQTLSSRLFGLLVTGADLAQPFAQFD